MRAQRGFTLIEVLVALAIVSIALFAGTQAISALTTGSERQSDTLLAHVCAENELHKLRLSRQMPSVGNSEQACTQAGRDYRVRLEVRPTPNPSFRRVDARVIRLDENSEQAVLSVTTIVGRF
jgi:general secretion pathway protein I